MRRNGNDRACARFKLNIQIIRRLVDAAGHRERAVSVIGKVDHAAPNHGISRLLRHPLRRRRSSWILHGNRNLPCRRFIGFIAPRARRNADDRRAEPILPQRFLGLRRLFIPLESS